MAWCRESTRRRSAGASELVRRIPRRRRAGDGLVGTLGAREATPFAALAAEGPVEVAGPAWRRAAGDEEQGEGPGRTSRFQPSVWSHRVRSR